MIKPKKLNKGDRVAIVSLSSGILGEDYCAHQIELGKRRLEEMGLNPVFMPNSLKGVDFIKANPGARASDLKSAFNDDSIKAILCAIGGEDTYKIIPYLLDDEEFIESVRKNPKIFIGFSDSTNNHFMFHKLGLTTYYGLNFLSDVCELGMEMLPYTKLSYERFFRNDEAFEIISSPVWYENRNDFSISSLGTECTKRREEKGYEVLYGKGRIRGRFFGGCIESIYDMYASERYEDQRDIYNKYDLLPKEEDLKDTILFLETSEEKVEPTKFKRMIELFISENVLTSVKALIVGKPYDEVYYDEYKEILTEVANEITLPILFNVNFGHSLPRAMIPYGIMGEVDFDNLKLMVVEAMFDDKY